MLNFQLSQTILAIALVSQFAIASLLTVVVIFFTTLLCLGVRKSYKLKKENERLESMSPQINDEKDKPYNDFTQGHMYDEK
ncbi:MULTISPECIES: hypothetical protein [unclassified Algibacter]|uniref:hypothetical protein n=1 Tax=unclassified Algibacter TaxID=2615009 RepID=UPI00131ADA91|nr:MULTISPECIES: hypothetical protein [unclassified Algibacter]MCL5130264.1 hypothetical protein [Algibacter sp. L4_22]